MFRLLFLLTLSVCTFTAAWAADFYPDKLTEIDAAIRLAITEGRTPGGVFWLEHGGTTYHKAYGNRALEPQPEPISEDTIYDAASLTKVMATTPSVMKLVEDGKIDLDAPVSKYLPEFAGGAKDKVTIRNLMTHTSATASGVGGNWTGYENGIHQACVQPLQGEPGKLFRYADTNFILLAEVVHKVSGKMVDEFAAENVFKPLGMRDTGYRPATTLKPRIAPTTRDTERGIVHDPTSRKMGGVAGHAGLFTTAEDTAKYCRMLLGEGTLNGVRILKPETVRLMISVQSPPTVLARRGLGWDLDTGYSGPRGRWFPLGSYGHTGWTGGSFWIDPFSKSFVIFLSNRNHPTEAGNVLPLRRTLGTIAAEAIPDFNFLHVPNALKPTEVTITDPPRGLSGTTATVFNGIDVLARERFARLKGLRVGIITNHTGIDRQRRRNIDLLAKADGVQLTAIFSPEHGLAGKLDEKVGDSKDTATGLPIFSLYGEHRAPTAEQLSNVDILVYDIQDVGCRFYTYSSTLGECLAAAGKEKKKFMVLDRPNPVGGLAVEGPVRDGESSFVAWHDVPLRHGMTVGELARMFNDERHLGADLSVVSCEGWTRGLWFDETTLPWVNPSPNMRSLTAAALYPGIGVLEFCNISVGRGTDRPFEYVGAPYLNDRNLANLLNAANLSGVRFLPVHFTPTASVFASKECSGVQILVLDRRTMNAVDVGLEIARALQSESGKEWQAEKLTKLLVHPATLKGILDQRDLSAIKTAWVDQREAFAVRRLKYLDPTYESK